MTMRADFKRDNHAPRKILAYEKTAMTNCAEMEPQQYENIKPALKYDASSSESNPNTPLDAKKMLEQPKVKPLLVRVKLLVSMRTFQYTPEVLFHPLKFLVHGYFPFLFAFSASSCRAFK